MIETRMKNVLALGIPVLLCSVMLPTPACAQKLTLARNEATVMVEPYAPNIVRVTLSLDKARALAPPGFGFVAVAAPGGWAAASTSHGDVLRSERMVVTVSPQGPAQKPTGTQADIGKFFGGSTPNV